MDKFNQSLRWLRSHPYTPSNTVYNNVDSFDSGRMRNKPCICGSGIKYKYCCMPNQPKNIETQLSKKLTDKEVRYWKKRYDDKVKEIQS